jgi:hypothetical protein
LFLCEKVERICHEKMGIPVFHDDQHGTAVVVSAAIKNALILVKKDISKIRLVCTGAGAAAIAWRGLQGHYLYIHLYFARLLLSLFTSQLLPLVAVTTIRVPRIMMQYRQN